MRKTVAAIILILCVLLAGCQGTTPQATATPSPSVEPAASSVAAEATPEATPEASAVPEKPTRISFATNNVCDSEAAQEVYVSKFLEDTGVQLDWIAFPKEEFEEKLMAALMGGDRYDVIDAPTNINPLIRQELLVDLHPLIEANNTGLKQVVQENPAFVNRYAIKDAIYGFAVGAAQTMPIFYRADLLEAMGLSEPKTMDEFTGMLRKVKQQYPDMIPLTSPSGYFSHEAISSAFGVKNQIAEKDGKYVDFTLTEDYREFLDYMKLLYTEGLIDKELPTNSSYGAVRTKYYTGKAFGQIMWENTIMGAVTNMEQNELKGAVPAAMKGFPTDKGYFGIRYALPEAPLCITVGAKDPQFVLDTFFNWYVNTDSGILLNSAGVEGILYEVVDGVYTPLDNPHGHTGLSFPAPIRGYEYPFKFNELLSLRMSYVRDFMELAYNNPDTVILTIPAGDNEAYGKIVGDLDALRQEIYYLYLTGQIDYDTFCSRYKEYADSVGLDDMIQEMNK